jgi:hypothetical protein
LIALGLTWRWLQLEGPHIRNVAFAVVLVAIPSSAMETVDSTNI